MMSGVGPVSRSNRAGLIVARSCQDFALIICASEIASRKSVSANSVCACLKRSSPRVLKASGRNTSSSGFICSARSTVSSASPIAPLRSCASASQAVCWLSPTCSRSHRPAPPAQRTPRNNQLLPHCNARMGRRAAIGLAMLFCGGPKVTPRRAWQTEAHPRYGVTRGEELGLEAARAGSGARAGTQLINGRRPASPYVSRTRWSLPERNRWTLLPT
jgi:hypothetical protein